jgi:starch-binding outer membrane protein, SusD/RagB family
MPIKQIRYRLSTLILFLSLQSTFSSCKKFLDIPPPGNLITTENLFLDDQSAVSAINGLYSQMMVSNIFFANAGFTVMPALSADELYLSSPNDNFESFQKNAITTMNFYNHAALWKKGFQHIYHANAMLEGLAQSTTVSKEVKDQLAGEAKFVRAFCYFYLINLYGDVPLILSTGYEVNASIPRTGVAVIYQQITSDLLDAKRLMGPDYPSTGKVRPSRNTAVALLARVYLYQGKWPEAEAESSLIISSGTYTLSSLENVFLPDSPETIWQLLPVLTFLNTADGFTFIPYSTTVKPPYVITDWLLNAFEANDQRKVAWIKGNTVDGQTYYYPFKYKVRSGSAITEYNMMFRLAEQYLIRAEARAQQSNISGAQSDLDQVRVRAGLPATSASDKTNLLLAIERENQIEFLAENGHRWFDLKRNGRIDAILGAEKPSSWQSTDALYPIPLAELQANPKLTQNQGY